MRYPPSMRAPSFLVGLVMIASSACGGAPRTTGAPTPASPPSSTGSADPSDSAPTPYTAAQLRDACKRGRLIELRVEAAGKPAVRRVMTFVSVDDQGAEVATVTLDASGAALDGPKVTQATWEELRKHAEFPRAAATITKATVTVPAGTFDCLLYEVRDGNEVSRSWFAKALPGPPVQWTVDRTGARVLTVTMLASHPGA